MKAKSYLFMFYRSIFVFILILVASLISSDEINKVEFDFFKNADKLVHFGMYFTLSFIVVLDLLKARTGFTNGRIYLITVIFCLFYGGILELIQQFLTRTRSGDLFDFIFDLLGALAAISVLLILRRSDKIA